MIGPQGLVDFPQTEYGLLTHSMTSTRFLCLLASELAMSTYLGSHFGAEGRLGKALLGGGPPPDRGGGTPV